MARLLCSSSCKNPIFRKIANEQKGGDVARTFDARSYLC